MAPPAGNVSRRCLQAALSQTEGMALARCKKTKSNGDDILAAKKRWEQPPTKQVKCLASAIQSHQSQINSLTAQNQKMMTAFIALAIDIPKWDSCAEEDDKKDHKIAANKKNPNLTKTNKKTKS